MQYVPLFYRVQRPLLRGAVADRDSITRLRNLLLDFHSACHELKRDQQALSILLAAMRRQGLPENLSRDALKQLEVSPTCHPLHLSIACCAWLYLNYIPPLIPLICKRSLPSLAWGSPEYEYTATAMQADDLRLALTKVLIPPGRKTKVRQSACHGSFHPSVSHSSFSVSQCEQDGPVSDRVR